MGPLLCRTCGSTLVLSFLTSAIFTFQIIAVTALILSTYLVYYAAPLHTNKLNSSRMVICIPHILTSRFCLLLHRDTCDDGHVHLLGHY